MYELKMSFRNGEHTMDALIVGLRLLFQQQYEVRKTPPTSVEDLPSKWVSEVKARRSAYLVANISSFSDRRFIY
jgi:hypothetical protein